MPQLPRTIPVAGHSIPIIGADLPEDLGTYDTLERQIHVDRSVLDDPRRVRDVLVHEAVHCALDLCGASSYSSSKMSASLEEQVVCIMESIGAPVIDHLYRLYPLVSE